MRLIVRETRCPAPQKERHADDTPERQPEQDCPAAQLAAHELTADALEMGFENAVVAYQRALQAANSDGSPRAV